MTVTVRSGVLAAASIFVLAIGFAPIVSAQEAAPSANAELAARGAWSPGTTYAKDDIVTARGSAWISLRANNTNRVPGQTRPSTAAYWQLFARGFNPAGAWSNATVYQPDDLVTHLGQTYRATITNTNRQPPSAANWELLVTKGANGEAGPQGAQGPQGDQGPAAPGIEIALGTSTLFLHNRGLDNTGLGLGALGGFSVTGNSNTAMGRSALGLNSTGTGNTAVGALSLNGNQTGERNNAIGYAALRQTNGNDNVAIGYETLHSNTSGSFNVGVGNGALSGIPGGSHNTALGYLALSGWFSSGSRNVGVGYQAGYWASNSSDSIFIGNTGASADTATIRIGAQGTQTTSFMAGIRGIATGVNDAVAVMIDSSGQLGTVSSSQRYKTEIETMADVSTMLAALRPVMFRYKQAQSDGSHPLQYGLIAEDVANVFPDLAVFNKDGSAETVKYHLLPSFLLAGWQAQQKTIATQAEKIETQSAELADLKQRLANVEAMLPKLTRAAAR